MRGKSARIVELIKYARTLLKEDHPQTLRQLHYAIFSRNEIDYDNDRSSYDRLSRVTSEARRDWREWELDKNRAYKPPELGINPQWMIDETREAEEAYMFENAEECMENMLANYNRDLWQDQQNHVEIWCEKATILGSLRPIKDEWGVTLQVSHGYSSATMEDGIGRRFARLARRGKRIHVFYLGDLDPSGVDIERNLQEKAETASGVKFKMRRLAIHPEDISRFHLPPQRIKTGDTRAKQFKAKFGKRAVTVELDALPAAELRHRVEKAVRKLIDFELWNRQSHIQQVEIDSITEFMENFKNLPQAEL